MPSKRRTYSAKHRLRRRTKIAVVVLLTAVFTLGTCTVLGGESSTRGVWCQPSGCVWRVR